MQTNESITFASIRNVIDGKGWSGWEIVIYLRAFGQTETFPFTQFFGKGASSMPRVSAKAREMSLAARELEKLVETRNVSIYLIVFLSCL